MASKPFAFLEQPPVLVSGAGPTGLVAALWLDKFKVPFKIIDPELKHGTTSRAMVIHARPLEFYEQLGIADRLINAGTIANGMRIYSKGQEKGEITYKSAGKGMSKHPVILILGQDAHEAILNEVCIERGIKLDRGIKLKSLVESQDGVDCTLENVQTGETEHFRASYVIGADGAHSVTRKSAGIPFTGGTYPNRAYVADVTVETTSGYSMDYLNMNISSAQFCMFAPYNENTARLVGFVPPDEVDENGDLKNVKELQFSDIEAAVYRAAPLIKIKSVQWFSTYRVHHRVAERFQSQITLQDGKPHAGRLFLCGDAGHVHSPVGGQGMNTGICDSVNLAWKLAAVHSGSAPAALLETYNAERHAFAESLVNTTDTIFNYINERGIRGWLVRNIVMPIVMPFLWRTFPAFQKQVFIRASQLGMAYSNSMLNTNGQGITGSIKAGDRLPWVQVDSADESDNAKPLQDCRWQAHVYGTAEKKMTELLAERSIPLEVFPWISMGEAATNMQSKGLGKDMMYLVRPDGHVGLVCTQEDDQILSRYLDRWEIGTQTR